MCLLPATSIAWDDIHPCLLGLIKTAQRGKDYLSALFKPGGGVYLMNFPGYFFPVSIFLSCNAIQGAISFVWLAATQVLFGQVLNPALGEQAGSARAPG